MSKKNRKKTKVVLSLVLLVITLLLAVFAVNYSSIVFNLNKYAAGEGRCVNIKDNKFRCMDNHSYECSDSGYIINVSDCTDNFKCIETSRDTNRCVEKVSAKPSIFQIFKKKDGLKPTQKEVTTKEKDSVAPSKNIETKNSVVKTAKPSTIKTQKAI